MKKIVKIRPIVLFLLVVCLVTSPIFSSKIFADARIPIVNEKDENKGDDYAPFGGISDKESKKSNEEILKETLSDPNLSQQQKDVLLKRVAESEKFEMLMNTVWKTSSRSVAFPKATLQ